ncbi:M55 family metallopeptidase [Agromyces laixinhei]|uniref:M55 family metallopeptidase n=1 Tax=Agromyces laixinhei TaxID=2585717 RepID=UPI0012ED9A15|nr:M55 family metallopeptidase [Agromyces laixinhei]
MKVYISIDMEGVAGIATRDQITRGGHGYPSAQELMTAEANAAVAGAFAGGATAVTINDSHGTMDNLIPSDLDPRARLVLGKPKLQCMAAGVSPDDDVALFIGYHAPAGGPGVLAHTFSAYFTEVRLNGIAASEADVNLMQLSAAGVPLGLVTGDDVTCALVGDRMPGVRTVEVKRALGWSAADSMSPSVACAAIRAAAEATVSAAAGLRVPAVPEVLDLEIDLPTLAAADLAQFIPGVRRTGPFTVAATLPNPDAVVGFIVVVYQLTANSMTEHLALVNRR